MQPPDNWPFDQPPNCAVMTTRQVMNQEEPVLAVYHDEDDDGWQFIGSTPGTEDNGCIISLEEAVMIDSSVLSVADIPPGWFASRSSPGVEWNRKKNPRELEDDPLGLDPGVTPTSIGGAIFQAICRQFKTK